MKKLLLTFIIGLGLVLSASAIPTTTITWAPNHSATGGEFILTQTEPAPFRTFCLEENEYIDIGGTYFYTVSDRTDGGVSGPGDPISQGTAFLYYNFRNGTLPGYTGTSAQQTQLQNAIWWLENEVTTIPPGNPWLTYAQLNLTGDLKDDAEGLDDVVVWNLFDGNGTHKQSQLAVATHVPDSGNTLGLMGLSLFGLIAYRKF